jgi:hypothetical protein
MTLYPPPRKTSRKPNNKKQVYLHLLAYTMFVGKIPRGQTVHNVDHDKLNWAVANLELIPDTIVCPHCGKPPMPEEDMYA